MYLHRLGSRRMLGMGGATACPRPFRSIRKDNVPISQAALDKNKISDYTLLEEILFQKWLFFENVIRR